MLSSICEGILGWLFAKVVMLSAICEGILGWLYGRGGHACCPQMGMHSFRYMRGYIRVAFWKWWACCPQYLRLY